MARKSSNLLAFVGRACCVDCGAWLVSGWNLPDTPGADGTAADGDPDPLCWKCFDHRHGADALADAAERANEDRIRNGD